MVILEGFLLNRLDLKVWKAPGAFSQYTLRTYGGVLVAFGTRLVARRWRFSPVSKVATVSILWLATLSPTISLNSHSSNRRNQCL